MFKDVWRYRYFIFTSIRNEFSTRFARSRFGTLWMIINPLVQVAIYALVLSQVLAAKLPHIDNKYAYSIYLMAGLLAWSLFSDIVTRNVSLFIDNGNLMKKINFPHVTLPCIAIGSSLLNNLLLFLAMLGVLLCFGVKFSLLVLWIFPLMLIVMMFSFGVGLILGVINVFLRDLNHVVPIALQVGFWLTPIVYTENIIPDSFQHWLNLNPIVPIVNAYHQILVYGNAPELKGLFVSGFVGLLLMWLGLFLFRRASSEMVDVL